MEKTPLSPLQEIKNVNGKEVRTEQEPAQAKPVEQTRSTGKKSEKKNPKSDKKAKEEGKKISECLVA